MKNNYTIFKSAKEGNTSFQLTAKLLDSIYNKAKKIGKTAEIVITIPNTKNENYTVTCIVTKEK